MSFTLTRANRALALFLGSSAASRFAAAIRRSVPSTLFRAASGRHSKFAFFEALEGRELMSATYYVSPSGNDYSSGTSTSAPWKSIGKVDDVHLNPGDKVLFQGGATFGGSLKFYNDGGSASNPITIGSYGSGRATIASGTSNGAWLLGTTGLKFENLKFLGTRGNTGSQDGIRIENSAGNSTKSGITVDDCDISGYAQSGICFGTDGGNEYLSGITITNNNIYNNVMSGIQSYSASGENNLNVYIAYNQVHNNYGDGVSTCTGSGIMLGGVNGATVEHNNAYDNGAIGGNGGVGIWAYSSNAVTFQYNQSYDNKSPRQLDGDGFDFDADVSNSVMQYNLAYGNDGAGFLLDQWKNDNTFTNNTIRFNVSESNCKRYNYGEMEAWGKVLNSSIYNNVIYSTANSSRSNVGIRIHNSSIPGLYSSNVHVANNVIETTGGEDLILIPGGETQGMKNVTLDGNVYYSNGAALNINIGGRDYTSLSSLQSAGWEKFNGAAVGMVANPMFKSPGGEVATSGTFSVSSMAAYFLQSSTPIRNAGVNLSSLLGIAVPSVSSAKTIPGIDQSLAGATPATSSAPVTTTPPTTSTPVTTTPAKAGTVGGAMSGWDIGSVSHQGANGSVTSSVSITSGGANIGGTSDAFRYIYTTLTGNGQIVAKVNSFSSSSGTMNSGVMIRNGTAANAAEVSLLLTPNDYAEVKDRTTAGASTATTFTPDSGDQYVKLVREGTTFSSYISSNGTNWSLVGTTIVAMGTTVDIGLAVQDPSSSTTGTSAFSNIAVTGLV